MHLRLKRTDFTPISTIGELFIDDTFYCYTLEDTMREISGQAVKEWKIPGETAIPIGTYEIILTTSPRFKKILPRLMNVSGYEGVLIHAGNTSKDTEGCILVGLKKEKNTVTSSRIALEGLITRLSNTKNEKITIAVE